MVQAIRNGRENREQLESKVQRRRPESFPLVCIHYTLLKANIYVQKNEGRMLTECLKCPNAIGIK